MLLLVGYTSNPSFNCLYVNSEISSRHYNAFLLEGTHLHLAKLFLITSMDTSHSARQNMTFNIVP